MGVPHAHGEVAAIGIPLPPLEPAHDARRHPEGAEHHREGSGEVLAVARPPHEEELLEGRQGGPPLEGQGVGELAGQVLVEPERRLVRVAEARRHLAGEGRDPLGERRELEVAREGRVVAAGEPPRVGHAAGPDRLELRLHDIVQPRRGDGDGDAAHLVHRDLQRAGLDPHDPRGGEDDVGADGLEEELLPEDPAAPAIAAQPEVVGHGAAERHAVRLPDGPRPPVELVEDDPAPAQIGDLLRRPHALGNVYPHRHARVRLDLTVGSQLHAVGEAGDEGPDLGPEGQRRQPDARDDEEERCGDQQGRGRRAGGQPEQPAPPGEVGRDADHDAARGRLRLGQDVLEQEHPGGQEQEGDEDEQEAHAEGARGRRHQHEERQKGDHAAVARDAEREEPGQHDEEQEMHQPVEDGLGEIQEIRRGGDGGSDGQGRAERSRAHACPQRLLPPARHEPHADHRHPHGADQPGQEERGQPVDHQEIACDADGQRGRHLSRSRCGSRASSPRRAGTRLARRQPLPPAARAARTAPAR